MDNVSHSIAGLLLAEAAVQLRARREHAAPSARFRAVAAMSSMIGANLPDADLVYTGFGGDRLRYMLHHRGYTHTIVFALAGALLLWGAAALVWRWRERRYPSTTDTRWLVALLLVSTFSHLVLDWTNSYGVHPFWPVDDRWRYGDAVFIVEPWLWVVSVPALVAASRSTLGRILLSLVLLGGVALAWRVSLVSLGAAAALTAGAALFVFVAYLLRPGARAATAVLGWIGVTTAMTLGTRAARAAAVAAVHESDAAAALLDVVVSPLPANPLCASVITVERSGERYRASTARVSAAPSLVDAARCASRDVSGSALGLSPRRSTPSVHWDGEWSAPGTALAALARQSCTVLAALRFIRVPIWRAAGDSMFVLGDARFGSATGAGFTDVRVRRRPDACPPNVPPWVPPRADLLAHME